MNQVFAKVARGDDMDRFNHDDKGWQAADRCVALLDTAGTSALFPAALPLPLPLAVATAAAAQPSSALR